MNDPDELLANVRLLSPAPSPDHVRSVLTGEDPYAAYRARIQKEFTGQRKWTIKHGPPDQAEPVSIQVIEDRVIVRLRKGHRADQEMIDRLNESMRARFYDPEDAKGLKPWFELAPA